MSFGAAIWAEILKARRSRMPWLTALAFSIAPIAGGYIMVVLKDPVLARRLGLISTKAQLLAGSADWPTYLDLLAQATAIGGFVLFGLITSWVFGREYADRTLKDLLAMPTPRSTIVGAKFVLITLWCTLLTILIYLLGLGVGMVVGLPLGSPAVFRHGTVSMAVTAALTMALITPTAFFANIGRGYLSPIAVTLLAVVLAQIIAVAGWGEFFPWAIPALYAGMAGPEYQGLGAVSYVLIVVTGLAGLLGTFGWWEWADQT